MREKRRVIEGLTEEVIRAKEENLKKESGQYLSPQIKAKKSIMSGIEEAFGDFSDIR